MKAVSLLALSALLLAPPVPAAGKGKICFTRAEESAEQLVRGGLRLREGATACDGAPWQADTLGLWRQVDERFGRQFKQQTDIRRAAFVREFANDAENRVQMWDGRIVLQFRNYPLSAPYCSEIKKTLQTMLKAGWGSFVKHAQRAMDEVEMDYRLCN